MSPRHHSSVYFIFLPFGIMDFYCGIVKPLRLAQKTRTLYTSRPLVHCLLPNDIIFENIIVEWCFFIRIMREYFAGKQWSDLIWSGSTLFAYIQLIWVKFMTTLNKPRLTSMIVHPELKSCCSQIPEDRFSHRGPSLIPTLSNASRIWNS